MADIDALRAIVEPVVDSLDAAIYDLEFENGTLKITVDRPGGVDLETIAEVTRQVSRQLDLDDPIPGRYTLEVTSPGLERNLRTTAHWTTAIGDRVRVKTRPHVEGDRRLEGVVSAVDGDTVTLTTDAGAVQLLVTDVDRARTVFEWGPQPKPGGPKPKSKAAASTTPTDAEPSDPTSATMAADDTSRGGHGPSKEHA